MKNFKKIGAILLSVLLIGGVFAACGGNTETEGEGGNKESLDIKVGFIFLHDENSTYDKNFIDAANAACDALGISAENRVLRVNIPENQECYDAAADLVEQGCNFIFADSFGHEPFMIDAAKAYPDVQFFHATGTRAHTENLANYHNAFAAIYDGRYLAGIAAGMKLNEMIEKGEITAEEAKIGYVGAYTYAEVISGFTSFYLGARSVCPSATMEVTFTGTWYNYDLEQEGAVKLINNGCVLISQHADSMGAPTACEQAKVPNVSYNGSTISVGENTYIISSRINWAPYMELAIKNTAEGKATPADWTGTIDTESVLLTDINTNVAADGTAEAIKAASDKIVAGELHVFDTSTFTVDPAKNATKADLIKVDADGHLTSYMADVDTDEAYAGDTEVVKDGYFHESEMRSAPYFDLTIDGIDLLDTAF